MALELLKKEFPKLTCLELPSYDVKYPKKGYFFKLNLLKGTPKVLKAIKSEKKLVSEIIQTYKIEGIISDNRLGVYSELIPSVIMTHQLKVLSGNTTWLSTKMHQNIIQRFDECWVPDNVGISNLSGKLGHAILSKMTIRYIGPLSRFKKLKSDIKYDLMVLLSGPEPQRTLLEEKLLAGCKTYDGKVLFVKGVIEKEQSIERIGNMTIYNYMIGSELGEALNESSLVLSRSGYTTIMDLAKLEKKAFFIPTPGQFEQEYLADRLTLKGFVPSCKQSDFTMEKLKHIDNFKGFETFDYDVNYKKLFGLFKGK
jgi:UDP-N-acetylglucosamine transferase subunit ALG13